MKGIDETILAYVYDVASSCHKEALDLLMRFDSGEFFALAERALIEFNTVMSDGQKVRNSLSCKETVEIIESVYSLPWLKIYRADEKIEKKVWAYAARHNINFCHINHLFIAMTLAEHQVFEIITANEKNFRNFDFIEAINPFSKVKEEASAQNSIIPYGRHTITEQDIASVCSVLRSDWLTQGAKVTEFEQNLCHKFGSQYATVVSSGTAALHLASLALGWQESDIVLTSPLTFLASANCILYAGATPDFVDIDLVSYTIDPNQLETKVKLLRSQGKRPKAIVAVDYAGHPCDWEALREIADQYELQLVDDACHALGAIYKGQPLGSCKYADVTVFSFHPVKHITTGEGGAVLTNDRAVDKHIKLLRSHGVIKSSKKPQKNEEPWYYEMQELGFNYRVTDFQCALGVSQLKRLDEFIKKRQYIATYYNERFAQITQVICPNVSPDISHAWHLYPLQIDFDSIGLDKPKFFQSMKEKNIGVQVHYIPVHMQPYYQREFSFKNGDFPAAESFYVKEVSLPVYPSLKFKEMEYVANHVIEFMDSASVSLNLRKSVDK